jgi:hypothetical protein
MPHDSRDANNPTWQRCVAGPEGCIHTEGNNLVRLLHKPGKYSDPELPLLMRESAMILTKGKRGSCICYSRRPNQSVRVKFQVPCVVPPDLGWLVTGGWLPWAGVEGEAGTPA